MRLTLRTLLAYLDDQLSPGEAKEIGAKLKDAPAARALADRTKEAVRRRRLGVPGDPAAGGDAAAAGAAAADPNEVAAYLDNALPPDRVAAVEQTCLDDDAHLAEVAACHQILTQVLSEPAHVRPATTARLLGLAPAADPEADAGPAARMAAAPAATAKSPATLGAGGTAADFDASLPDHLKASTRRGWGWVPWAVGLALGGVWLASLLLDDGLLRPSLSPTDSADRIAALDPAAAGLPGEPAVAGAPEPAEAPATAVPAPAAGVDPEEAARLARQLPLDPPPPEDRPAPAAGAPNGATARPTDELAAAEEAQTPGGAGVSPEDSPPGRAAPAVTVAAGRGLFAFDPDRSGFFAVEPGAAVPAGEPLLTAGPLRASLSVEGVPLELELLGGTRVTLAAGPSPAAPLAVLADAGRVRLTGAGGAGDGGPVMILVAGGANWAVAPAAGATAGLLVTPRLPRGAEARVTGNPVSATLYAAGGPVTVTDLAPGATGEAVQIPPGSMAVLVTDGGALAAPAAAETPGGVPAWVADPDPSRADELVAEKFAGSLVPGQPLRVSLPPVADGQRESLAVPAVETMALARDAADVARALKRSPLPSVVRAAADGLRGMLGRSPDLDAAVRDGITREFSLEAPVQLERLLDRLTDAEARDPAASEQLVSLLESDELAVRVLAVDELRRLTGLDKRFNPVESPGNRASAVRRWRAHLQRTGAVLDPDGARPDPAPPVNGEENEEEETGAGDATGLDFGGLIPDDL